MCGGRGGGQIVEFLRHSSFYLIFHCCLRSLVMHFTESSLSATTRLLLLISAPSLRIYYVLLRMTFFPEDDIKVSTV